jgi:CheY-like chemotaxis protein
MQGGSIGVESTQSLGSTFTFYVRSRKAMPPSPVATPLPLRPAANVTSTRALSIPQPVPQSPTTTSNLHILVVEDNLINQRVLSNQLRKLGHTVHVAGHGGEALDQLRKTTYHRSPSVSPPLPLSVVLMDVEMPVMDGLTCTRRIREMEASSEIVAHVPIIAVSANARREQVEQARSAGMDDAISKPFRIPELIPKIWMLVG